MAQGPLVKDQIEMGARIVSEAQALLPLQAAFWLRNREDGDWGLYFASDQADDGNRWDYADQIRQHIRQLNDPWFGSPSVRVLNVEHPIARVVMEMRQQFPAATPQNYDFVYIRDVGMVELWIYPLPVTSA